MTGMETNGMRAALADAPAAELLARLYGAARVPGAQARCAGLLRTYEACFGAPAAGLFSAPGRTELGGNHTDHQRGRVLAAGVNLDILAAAAPNGENVIRVRSEGFPTEEIGLDDLSPRPEEANRSAALIRGVAARVRALGGRVEGFNACLHSTVPGGSGLSSSAAYEVLLAGTVNELFNAGRFSPETLARIGQYAENVYFGKPSGLMDQMACAVGGVAAIDFADPDRPALERLEVDLAREGYALCILDAGADHADLTGEYAAIAGEMRAVAACFGREVLGQVDRGAFLSRIGALRQCVGDRAVLRALHFFDETGRALAQAQALRAGEFSRFLALAEASGRSSALYLQNVIPPGQSFHQELALTLALCAQALDGRGACRVHGGGFGGTAQAFVPLDALESFRAALEAPLGAGRCHVLSFRPVGFVRIL